MIKNNKELCDICDLDLKSIQFEGSVVVMLNTVQEVEKYVALKHLLDDIIKRWLYNIEHDAPIVLGYIARSQLER